MNIGRLRQFHAAFACGFGSLDMGILTAWPSYTTELLTSNETTPLSAPMTKMDISLLGSLPSLGAILGTAIAGACFNTFGRRNGGVLISLPFVISWAMIAVTSSINMVLAARFLAGIAAGGTLVLVPVLVSEVSDDSIRGMLASVSMFQYCIGTFMSYMMGWFLSYNMVIWINIVLSIVCTVLIMLSEETAVYWLMKRREEDAKISISKYRGVPVTSKIVQDELYRLKKLVWSAEEMKSIIDPEDATQTEKEKLNPSEKNTQVGEKMSSYKMLFMIPSSRRAFIVVTVLTSLQVFMGLVPVQVFLSSVFAETDPSKADLYTVVFAIVQFIGALVTVVAADKYGRRVLQLGSSAIVCFCLAALGVLIQFKIAPPWVTVAFIMIFCFAFMMGVGSIPYVLLAEVFLPEVLNLATMVIIEWVWFLNFFIIGVFPYITDLVGITGAFYCFAIISFFNTIISHIIMPETAGLSSEQIQEVFMPNRKKSGGRG
ncbi:facilitated trehalose transporter Tret1-like [Anticarsia gemmatalis]|uniref:facilitated trehalose transporter Tret1-like n=1 Tax=Anticarsia gemmatalis TaxID=129554 RepID=UPI003F76F2AD